MSNLRLLLSLWLTGPAAFAAGLVLDGPPFSAPGISIIWNAPTNRWPATLWIYKAVPQEFSPAVVSNLMAIGPFTKKDRTNIEGQPPFKDKRLLYFANKERTRHLGIFPPFGWLYYSDEKARVRGKERAKGVPSEREALELALNWLDKFGIDRSQLATKDGSSDPYVARESQDKGWHNKATGEYVNEIISRGVLFVRRIDGVDFTGLGSDGGFHISFANEGKVADLELVWRNLKPHKSCKVISPVQMQERIERGEARMVPMTAVNLAGAKKLVINRAAPWYLGEAGDTPQEFTYPFASLECTLESDNGGTVGVVLKCPMLEQQ